MAEGRALRKIDKYEILAEISSGTTGTVFRVQFESQTFALKRLNFADATSIARFKQEAASIARLNHPNLVRIIDAGESEGTHFIVMELLEGKSLDIRIREGRFGVDDVIELAKSLASALAEVHRFGLIHRDVKPANIVILENGVAKLLDFGLVADTVSGALAGGREIAGTILYTSPEQIRILKRPVDARSDLYSLGITLFECICGRPPFQSDDIPELMRMHASAVAPSIQILAPEISTSVARIIAKLLEKDPDDRYQCAEGLVYDLQNLSKIEMAEKANGKVSIGIRDRQLSTMGLLPISGRKAELALLHQYFSDVESGKGTAILIEGESGCGKSRLTQELIFRAISSGGLVLHGKAQLQSNRTPFAPVREALEKLVQAYRALPPDEQVVWREKFNLSAQHAPKILVALAKPLKDIISSEQSEKVALSDESDGQRTLDDIATFIINLAIHFPNTLLLIDDVQWMDSRSVELLSRIAHRFHTAGILLLTTSRNDTESLDALNVFKGLMAPMLKPAIALGALSLDDVLDIVSKQLGNLPLKEGAV